MKSIKGISIEENVSLKNLNTYKIESKAKYLIKILSIEGLIETLKYLKDNNLKYFILGAGSNVILDDYFDGAIIKLDGLNYVNINDLIVTCGSGVMMGRLASTTVNNNLTGLEWAINIPGTVGGSVNGNAGAYNSEIFDNLISIKVLTKSLEVKEMNKEEFKYSYRHTNIKELGLIVLEATFELSQGNKEESLEIIKKRYEKRKVSQPLDMPSAGSVFRNPEGDHAGRLIEDAGLKGKRIGGAEVSLKHANFIVNTGNATSNDIKNLIKLVQDTIKEKYNIQLILEQEIIEWK
ncbi:MAG: UDP-N-acetylmuramate dehydrogenase [Firmicutes bacterium]|nr:UDP-N-acetylmuramate dehydrogenase [Bacillota bacterium]